VVRAPPVGLGYPVFDKLEAELAKALMSLPATKVCPQLRATRVCSAATALRCHSAQDSVVSQGAHEPAPHQECAPAAHVL
jgi:chorismate synthase